MAAIDTNAQTVFHHVQVGESPFAVLRDAISRGEDQEIARCVRGFKNLDIRDAEGNSILHIIALHGMSVAQVYSSDEGSFYDEEDYRPKSNTTEEWWKPGPIIEELLSKGADPNARNHLNQRPIDVMALDRLRGVTTYTSLLTKGIDINENDIQYNGRTGTILHHILLLHDKEGDSLRSWLDYFIDTLHFKLSSVDQDENTPLHSVCENLLEVCGFVTADEREIYPDVEWEEMLFSRLSSPDILNRKNKDGRTALHIAMKNHELRISEEDVLSYFVTPENINLKDNDGNTAFSYACSYKHGKLVNLLLDRGADFLAQNTEGVSAFPKALKHISRRRGNQMLAKTPPSSMTDAIVQAIAKTGHREKVVSILNENIRLEMKEKALGVSLHRSCKTLDLKLAKLVLSKGANPNFVGSGGDTPLHDLLSPLKYTGRSHVRGSRRFSFVINGSKKAEIQTGLESLRSKENNGNYLLTEIFILLIQYGADVSALDTRGKTPLNLIKDQEYKEEFIQLYSEIYAVSMTAILELIVRGVRTSKKSFPSPVDQGVGFGNLFDAMHSKTL